MPVRDTQTSADQTGILCFMKIAAIIGNVTVKVLNSYGKTKKLRFHTPRNRSFF